MTTNHSSKNGFVPCFIDFRVQYHVEFGWNLILSGSSPSLGSWNLKRGRKMRWRPGDTWFVRVKQLHKNEFDGPFEFKFVVVSKDYSNFLWERGENRKINISNFTKKEITSESFPLITVDCTWERMTEVNISSGSIPRSPSSKAIVVLGKKLLPNGQPTSTLVSRMEFSCKIFANEAKVHSDVFMIVTGGKVQTGNGILSEAEIMKSLAVQHGIKDSQVLVEDSAMNTIENVLNTREILEEKGLFNIIVITSYYHMERAKKIFERLLGDSFKIEYKEDTPKMTKEEKRTEEGIEKYMLTFLDEHLDGYLGAQFFEPK